MSWLPIVDRELRAAARRRATYWARLIFALAGAAVVGLALMAAAVSQTAASELGRGLFHFLSLVALGFSAFAGVFVTADCLSEEKREGTLGLLFLTDLKGYDVVFGKLAARALSMGYGLLALFPVLAVTLTMGGVTAGEFWRMAVVLLTTMFFSMSVGMFVSSLSRNAHRAMTGGAALIVFIGGVLPLAESILSRVGLAARFGLSLPSPLAAWQLAFEAAFKLWGLRFACSLLLMQTLSWWFLVLASVLLPRLWQEGARWTVGGQGRTRVVREAVRASRAAWRAGLLSVNPVYWLTARNSRLGWLPGAGWGGLAVLFGAISVVDRTTSLMLAKFSWPMLPLLLRILVGVQACRFFVETRRAGALEVLLCTPLTVDEILRGQWLALRRLFWIPAIATGCAAGLSFVSQMAVFPAQGFFPGTFLGVTGMIYRYSNLVCDVLAAAWVGMMFGLTAKRPGLAPGLTVLFTVVIPVAAFCIPDLFITLPMFLWARDKLYRELRVLGGPRFSPGGFGGPMVKGPKPPPLLPH